MARIFISYRRTDSADQAGRIFDRLVSVFSKARVFKDVDSVPAGADFRVVIEAAVQKAETVLMIVGPSWLSATDDRGHRRLDDQSDIVRLELESALRLRKIVIPVLVRGGTMPPSSALPESLKEVAFRNAVVVRPDPDFHRDMDRLIASIKKGRAENQQAIPPLGKKTHTWAPVATVVLGLLVCAIVITALFNQKGGPDRNGPPLKDQVPPIQAKNGSPEKKPKDLPFPTAPSKSMPVSKSQPGAISESPKPSVDIKAAQSDPSRPSAQAPHVLLDKSRADLGAAARRFALHGERRQNEGNVTAAAPVSLRKTIPSSGTHPSEEAPPPPLIPVVDLERSS